MFFLDIRESLLSSDSQGVYDTPVMQSSACVGAGGGYIQLGKGTNEMIQSSLHDNVNTVSSSDLNYVNNF